MLVEKFSIDSAGNLITRGNLNLPSGNFTATGNGYISSNITVGGNIAASTGTFTANLATPVVTVTQNGSGEGLKATASAAEGTALWGTGDVGVFGTGTIGVGGERQGSSGAAGVFRTDGQADLLRGINSIVSLFRIDANGYLTAADITSEDNLTSVGYLTVQDLAKHGSTIGGDAYISGNLRTSRNLSASGTITGGTLTAGKTGTESMIQGSLAVFRAFLLLL